MNQEISNSEIEKELQRKLPASIELEQKLLGKILVDYGAIEQVNGFLKAEHFYEILHQRIYGIMHNLYNKDSAFDSLTVKSILSSDTLYQESGGDEYLSSLANNAVAVINVLKYGRYIYDLSLKRSLIKIGEEVVNDAYESTLEKEAIDQLETAESKLYQLASEKLFDKSFVPVSEIVKTSLDTINRAKKNKGKLTGISSGLIDLDKKLTGFGNSDLIIMAGRPAMGKTAFAVNFAYNACKDLMQKAEENKEPVKSVGFFSLEMSDEQLVTRLLSMLSKIDSTSLKNGNFREEENNKLVKASDQLKEMPFFIDHSPSLSIAAVRSRARKLKRKHNLGILFIDYLQLMCANIAKNNRVVEISEITQGLKAIAKELNIPVIALAQLSRAVDLRQDKKPVLSDLRESGSIEQDADVVMLLYREEYYLMQHPPSETEQNSEWQEKAEKVHNVAEIIVAKHRNGSTGVVASHYDARFSKVTNLRVDGDVSERIARPK